VAEWAAWAAWTTDRLNRAKTNKKVGGRRDARAGRSFFE
jgi:hypothetical protein